MSFLYYFFSLISIFNSKNILLGKNISNLKTFLRRLISWNLLYHQSNISVFYKKIVIECRKVNKRERFKIMFIQERGKKSDSFKNSFSIFSPGLQSFRHWGWKIDSTWCLSSKNEYLPFYSCLFSFERNSQAL